MKTITNKDIEKLCIHCPEGPKPKKPLIKMKTIPIDAEVYDKVVYDLGLNPSCLFCREIHQMTLEFEQASKSMKD